MQLKAIPIKDINPAKYNPRKDLKPTDAQYQHIKNSIDTFGYIDPIIWNKRTGNIVGGHQRFKILVAEGATEIDCITVDMDPTTEMAANASLNKAQGEWDEAKLDALLQDLRALDYDMLPFGFEPWLPEKEDDFDADAALAEIETPTTQLGDVWQLGRHRLICGDSTSGKVITDLMAGQNADLVLTDPPYNVDYEGGTGLKIQNDKMKDEQFLQFLTDAFTRMYQHSKKGAAIYVFHADSEGYNFRSAFKAAGYDLRQCLIWVKNSLVMGRQDYQWRHEPVLYGWKEGASHAWYADRKQTTLVEFDRPQKSPDHPTMKPVGLCGYFIRNSSKEKDIVLDPFGGSGTTMIASEQLNRTCFMCELDPKYCDVIICRWEENTGGKAVLIDAGTKGVPDQVTGN